MTSRLTYQFTQLKSLETSTALVRRYQLGKLRLLTRYLLVIPLEEVFDLVGYPPLLKHLLFWALIKQVIFIAYWCSPE